MDEGEEAGGHDDEEKEQKVGDALRSCTKTGVCIVYDMFDQCSAPVRAVFSIMSRDQDPAALCVLGVMH